jgi:hypothetical protein
VTSVTTSRALSPRPRWHRWGPWPGHDLWDERGRVRTPRPRGRDDGLGDGRPVAVDSRWPRSATGPWSRCSTGSGGTSPGSRPRLGTGSISAAPAADAAGSDVSLESGRIRRGSGPNAWRRGLLAAVHLVRVTRSRDHYAGRAAYHRPSRPSPRASELVTVHRTGPVLVPPARGVRARPGARGHLPFPQGRRSGTAPRRSARVPLRRDL